MIIIIILLSQHNYHHILSSSYPSIIISSISPPELLFPHPHHHHHCHLHLHHHHHLRIKFPTWAFVPSSSASVPSCEFAQHQKSPPQHLEETTNVIFSLNSTNRQKNTTNQPTNKQTKKLSSARSASEICPSSSGWTGEQSKYHHNFKNIEMLRVYPSQEMDIHHFAHLPPHPPLASHCTLMIKWNWEECSCAWKVWRKRLQSKQYKSENFDPTIFSFPTATVTL